MKNYEEFKTRAEELGWIFEEYRMYKKVGDKEIDIEFCIGDFCVGIYDKHLELLEDKIRCTSILEAFVMSSMLKDKYSDHD